MKKTKKMKLKFSKKHIPPIEQFSKIKGKINEHNRF